MRVGSPARHGIHDNMPPGYEAMSPANQGLANAHDGVGTQGMTSGAMSKVYAEQQPERATYQEMQNRNLNVRDAETYAVNESLAGSQQAMLQDADVRNKTQVGLTEVLATIAENRLPSKGENLKALADATESDPEFYNKVARGRAAGTGNFA